MATSVQDFLKQNPSYIGRSNTANRPQPTQAPKKQTGKGGWLSSLISEGGAAGGAALGGSIGSVVPGLGTVIGAGIGGLIGGFGGRLAENKVRDNRNPWEASSLKQAGIEGALSGALSAGGEAFQLAKAGKALTGEKGALNVGKNIIAGSEAKNAGKLVGGVEGLGRGIKAGGMGLSQGASAKGVEAIGAQQSDELLKALKSVGIKPGSPEAIQRALEPKLTKLGSDIAAKYAKSNVALSTEELNKLGTNIISKVTTQGGLDKSAEEFTLEQVQRLVKSKDVQGLWEFTKQLEKNSINFGKSAEASSAAKESVARIIKDETRGLLNTKVPSLAESNSLYHTLLDANKLAIKGSRNMPGGGLVGKITSLSPVKGAEAKLGSNVERLGKGLAGTGGPISKFTNQAIRQSPGALARGFGSTSQLSEQLPEQSMGPDTTLYGPQALQGTQDLPSGGAMPQPQSRYSLDQAIADFQAAPDAKTQKAVMDYYNFVSSAEKAQNPSSSSNIGKVSAQQYQLSQQGMNALGQLADLIQKDPGVISRAATPGRSLPVVGGIIANKAGTSEFDTVGFATISSLLRAQSGAAVPDSEVRAYMKAYLPRAGDDQATVQRKLQILQYAFQSVLQGGQNSSSDLGSAIDYTNQLGAQ